MIEATKNNHRSVCKGHAPGPIQDLHGQRGGRAMAREGEIEGGTKGVEGGGERGRTGGCCWRVARVRVKVHRRRFFWIVGQRGTTGKDIRRTGASLPLGGLGPTSRVGIIHPPPQHLYHVGFRMEDFKWVEAACLWVGIH